jgi:cytochrome c oxidase subunit III
LADAHAHAHTNAALGHHFENLEQQHEANILGMWTFLVTELMLFGGLFLAYILFRFLYPEVFLAGSVHQSIPLGAFNTAVLITSSLTMALAVHAAQVGNQRNLQIFLAATLLLGLVFLGIKGYEYWEHWYHGLFPGLNFTNEHVLREAGPRGALFFFLYFMMTGIHALHMIVGMGIIAALLLRSRTGRYLGAGFTPIELMGMYWHFVDVVWVFLFPLLYLIGRHGGGAH